MISGEGLSMNVFLVTRVVVVLGEGLLEAAGCFCCAPMKEGQQKDKTTSTFFMVDP
jgi:hypothetical protein